MKSVRFFSLLGVLVGAVVFAAPGDVWPGYHGARRDNLSEATGLATSWPEGGPPLLWSAAGIGHGYSSVAVGPEGIYTAGTVDRQTFVVCIGFDGKERWRKPNGTSWEATERQRWAVPYAGARGTPTLDGTAVYHLSELGRLAVWDAATGEELRSVDLAEMFQSERPKYGLSESVLIAGDRLICCPAGADGYIVALDKTTGALLWANREIDDPVGYASIVPARIGETDQLITFTASRIIAVAPADGSLLWEYPFSNPRGNNACDVVVRDGLVFASTGYGTGSILLQPERNADGTFAVTEIRRTGVPDNLHGGMLCADGFLYGSGHGAKTWFCLDFATGDVRWTAPGVGSLTWAEGMLYLLGEDGALTLAKATPDAFVPAGSCTVPKGGTGAFWAHPVVCGGRLYVRHSDVLHAYDVRAPK